MTTCTNERCTCDPCTCAHCHCGATARLGDLERQVIDVLWEAGEEVSGRAVADAMPDHAYTTVATVLDRLARKGLVRRRKDGRMVRFAATGTRADHTASAMRDALLASHERRAALERFARDLTDEEAAIVRAALPDAP